MIFTIIIMTVLGITSVSDIKSREIPGWLLICCGVLSAGKVIFLLTRGELSVPEMALSLLPGLVLLALAYLSRQGVGYGDGLLALCIGPAVGAPALLTGMCVAIIVSGLFSGMLLATRKVGRKAKIPFVPFMTFGLGVMMFAAV